MLQKTKLYKQCIKADLILEDREHFLQHANYNFFLNRNIPHIQNILKTNTTVHIT